MAIPPAASIPDPLTASISRDPRAVSADIIITDPCVRHHRSACSKIIIADPCIRSHHAIVIHIIPGSPQILPACQHITAAVKIIPAAVHQSPTVCRISDSAVFLKPPAISILMPLSRLYIQTSYDAAASCKHCRCQKCHNLLFHRRYPPISDSIDLFLLFYWISSEDARKFLYSANIVLYRCQYCSLYTVANASKYLISF